jgi:ABC-2 type transport system permease protein
MSVGNGTDWSGWRDCARGVIWREALRFAQQRERFLAALVRPLVWLFIFAAGFRAVLGLSITPPYQTYVLYEVYVTPGLCAMVLLFQGMQSSLSMVYDRETGAMRALLIAPYPRWFLLACKLAASVAVGMVQVYAFLAVAWLYGVQAPPLGYLAVAPALALSGMLLAGVGLVLSSLVRQLENFAGVMNFVIFPAFFASSALYPLWRVREGSPLLADIAALNPFTHCVELIRHALYLRVEFGALAVVTGLLAIVLWLAARAYDPGRGLLARRGRSQV